MQLFDLHCDSIVNFCEEDSDFLCGNTQFSLRELSKFNRLCQTMAIFVPDEFRGEAAFAYLKKYEACQKNHLLQHTQIFALSAGIREI